MPYKRLKKEKLTIINRLMSRRYYYGGVKKSDAGYRRATQRFQEITTEIELIRKNPDSYEYFQGKYGADTKRQIQSCRSYISIIKHQRPDWTHKLPGLEQRLNNLLKSA